MWSWYGQSHRCYVYLSDVHSLTGNESADVYEAILRRSLWFTRCWTLQELLAPKWVTFHDRDWVRVGGVGSRELERRFIHCIASITGIPASVMVSNDLRRCNFAQRMSWAAHRKATRVEDMAYSLLGLFDINMPLLYGEGAKAFTRLQHEFMRQSTDLSILAWVPPSGYTWITPKITEWPPKYEYVGYTSVLAPRPSFFGESSGMSTIPEKNSAVALPWTITSKGLDITIDCDLVDWSSVPQEQVRAHDLDQRVDVFIVALDCGSVENGHPFEIALQFDSRVNLLMEEQCSGLVLQSVFRRILHFADLGESFPRESRVRIKGQRMFLPVRP